MNLPGYLQPQGDGWRIDDAVTLWGLIHYEIAVGTPDTPAVKRLRHRARREVAEVATKNPESPDPPRGPVLRLRRSNWVTGGNYPSSRMEPTRQGVKCAPSRTWVTVAALAGLCRQHGHPCPWEQEAEPAQQQVSAGRPDVLGELADEAFATMAAMEAASPGRRVTKAEAIRAVVDKHIPKPDPSASLQLRTAAQQKREEMTRSLTDKMKPSRQGTRKHHCPT